MREVFATPRSRIGRSSNQEVWPSLGRIDIFVSERSLVPSLAATYRPLLGEAHGGYTFCATASWILLQPYLQTHYTNVPKPTINYSSLLRWLTQMQGVEIELGGFKGRTNKLVDGCYSWWVGGCVVLVEGLLGVGFAGTGKDHAPDGSNQNEDEDAWDDVDGQYHSILWFKTAQQCALCIRLSVQSTSPTRICLICRPARGRWSSGQTTQVSSPSYPLSAP